MQALLDTVFILLGPLKDNREGIEKVRHLLVIIEIMPVLWI